MPPADIAAALEACLEAFAEKAGLDDLSLDEGGAATIRFGEGTDALDVTVEALEDEGRILLHATVLSLSGEPTPALLERLLGLALHGLGTGGGALGWDARRREAVLTHSYGFPDLDPARFEALLEATYASAFALREELDELEEDDASEAPPGGPGDAGLGEGERMLVIQG